MICDTAKTRKKTVTRIPICIERLLKRKFSDQFVKPLRALNQTVVEDTTTRQCQYFSIYFIEKFVSCWHIVYGGKQYSVKLIQIGKGFSVFGIVQLHIRY